MNKETYPRILCNDLCKTHFVLNLLSFTEEENFELEEEDYDLIEENIGVRLQDRVSLKLVNERAHFLKERSKLP